MEQDVYPENVISGPSLVLPMIAGLLASLARTFRLDLGVVGSGASPFLDSTGCSSGSSSCLFVVSLASDVGFLLTSFGLGVSSFSILSVGLSPGF